MVKSSSSNCCPAAAVAGLLGRRRIVDFGFDFAGHFCFSWPLVAVMTFITSRRNRKSHLRTIIGVRQAQVFFIWRQNGPTLWHYIYSSKIRTRAFNNYKSGASYETGVKEQVSNPYFYNAVAEITLSGHVDAPEKYRWALD